MVQLKQREFRQRIEHYLDKEDWAVVCRKRNGGYTFLWTDDEEPLARFKPTGYDDEVEVFWWNGERWRPVGEFGCIFRLNEALDFVFEDPEGIFLGETSADEEDEPLPLPGRLLFGPALGFASGTVLIAGSLGGALGGLSSGAGHGLVGGALLGYLAFLMFGRHPIGWRMVLSVSLTFGMPTVLAGAVGGTLGAALNEAVVTQWWGRFAGLLVGGLAGLLLFAGRPMTYVLSFLAGVALGLWLVGILNISQMPWACLVTALVAGGFSELCRWVARFPVVVGREACYAAAERKRLERTRERDSEPG